MSKNTNNNSNSPSGLHNLEPSSSNIEQKELATASSVSTNNIYKEENSNEITSPILKALIEKDLNDLKRDINVPNEFKALSTDDVKKQLEELDQLRSEIKVGKIELIKEDGLVKMINASVVEISEVDALLKVQNIINYFKKKNLNHDAIWESFKSKINGPDNCEIEKLKLSDMKGINDIFLKNKEDILDTLKRDKPLGELGEVTLNELVSKGSEIILPLTPSELEIGFSALSSFLIYKGVVRLYASLAFKEHPKNIKASPEKFLEYKKMKSKEIMMFMRSAGAPVIAGPEGLYAIKPLPKLNVELESQKSEGDVAIATLTSIGGLISFIKNRLPNWFKYITLIISFISLNYFLEKGKIDSILNNLFYLKLFFFFGCISSITIICIYLMNIYLYIYFSNKNKIKIQPYLPQFILNWLKSIEKLSGYEDEGFFIKLYLRLIVVYLLILLMCISILILLMNT